MDVASFFLSIETKANTKYFNMYIFLLPSRGQSLCFKKIWVVVKKSMENGPSFLWYHKSSVVSNVFMDSVTRFKFLGVLFAFYPLCFWPQLSPSWPEHGCLEFRNVALTYRDGLPNALDGVSLMVRPGEKIGIVGRTGSGKSTIFLALFRMVELSQGQILLDQLDITTVGLVQLRYIWIELFIGIG